MKKNRVFIFGMLAMVLALDFVACDNGTGRDEIDIRTFPESLLAEWISDTSETLSVTFRNREPDEWIPVKNGTFNCSPVPSHFIVMKDGISENSYSLFSTVEGGRDYKALFFTAVIGNDGKLTISGAKEFVDVGRNGRELLSSFKNGSFVSDINGTYTRNQ